MELDYKTILIICGTVAVIIALCLGRRLIIRRNKDGLSIETGEVKSERTQHISVANGAKFEGSTIGDIAGIKSEGVSVTPDSKKNIKVFEKGKAKNANIGDIVGVKQERKSSEDKK